MKHRFLVYVTLFIISFTAAFYFNLHHPIFVELRNEGFYPSELTIAKGEEVIFVNKTNRSFWPASNPHPTHTIYSIFDSQKPVNPGKSWSFRFEKTGIFNYHDHLSPSFHGKIIVGDIETMPISQNECLKMKQPEQRTCFEDLLDKTLKTKGLDEGFKLFRELAKIAPNDCHQYAHNLGEYAFKTNVVGRKEIKAGPETSYCGYGFWHGFMGEMLASTDFNNATQFCETQIISAPELSREVKQNCYHGIGIGLIPDPPQIQFWGKYQPLLDHALGECDTIKDKNLGKFCHSGSFHAVINYMMSRQYNFMIDRNDPFALCFLQKEQYQKECFFQIAPQLPGLIHNNLPMILKLVKKIPDPYFENTAMLSLTNFTSQGNSIQEYLSFITTCQNFDSSISDACIPAVVMSIFKSGTPELEYVNAVKLCSSNSLAQKYKLTCFQRLISISRTIYDEKKMEKVCGIVERQYQKLCE